MITGVSRVPFLPNERSQRMVSAIKSTARQLLAEALAATECPKHSKCADTVTTSGVGLILSAVTHVT